ncbi:uncharacterized protein LOC8085397 isoform X1 [Sorghum bicolor]|uniref:uncharacterized protein LOC8085397 isoform X1 n=1 Tax=Sorghum bicolor TaxID=4558 RepID=UPI000B423668|nr:uncharacterized protein LOC8085397 isoform X1 [Sorghum bicolor]|eukprot:XP_021311295.1 uncharacterized protein LOC8085397 isoform X1 [Sorghum bicolor]
MTLDTPAAVVLELMTMGQQSAAHLRDLLRASSPAASSPHQELAAEILRCCGRVIDALRATTNGRKRKAAAAEYHQDAAATGGATWSPPPPPPGPPLKRRARGAEATREVTSGTTVDGFIWRKYGQKDINGHKHPRQVVSQGSGAHHQLNSVPFPGGDRLTDRRVLILFPVGLLQALLPLRAQGPGMQRDPAGAADAGPAGGVRDRLLRGPHVQGRGHRVAAAGSGARRRRLRLQLLGVRGCQQQRRLAGGLHVAGRVVAVGVVRGRVRLRGAARVARHGCS